MSLAYLLMAYVMLSGDETKSAGLYSKRVHNDPGSTHRGLDSTRLDYCNYIHWSQCAVGRMSITVVHTEGAISSSFPRHRSVTLHTTAIDLATIFSSGRGEGGEGAGGGVGLSFLVKVGDLFSVVSLKTQAKTARFSLPPPKFPFSKTILKNLTSCSAWSALLLSPINYAPNFFSPPWGCTPWLRLLPLLYYYTRCTKLLNNWKQLGRRCTCNGRF